jgi:hypothetical protein
MRNPLTRVGRVAAPAQRALLTVMALTTGELALAGCTLGDASGGGGEGGGIDQIGSCELANVDDSEDCGADCDAAVEGEEDLYKCTVACDDDDECGDGYVCVDVSSGTTVCLEDCSADECSSEADTCDEARLVCMAATATGDGATSETCDVELVDDAADCDEDCDATFADGGAVMCTTSCSVADQDCGSDAFRCVAAEGDGVCRLDCSGGNACPDEGYACEQSESLCVPSD